VGRFFGAGAQPPNAPGQFAPQAQFPQNQNIHNLPQHPGNLVGQQPGVLIQYHIQYQLPRQPQHQQQQNIQLHPPQPLQPVPQFPGFHGPGGVWHPWAVDARGFGNAAQNPPQEAPPAVTVAPTAAVQAQPPQPPTPFSPTTEGPANATQGGDRPTTPREAAALAALRRLDARRPSVGSQDPSSSPLPLSPTPPETVEAASSSLPSESTSSAHPTAAPNGSMPDQRLGIPILIPVYDYNSHGPPPGPSPNTFPQLPNGVTHSPYFRPPAGARGPSQPAQASTGAPSQPGNYQTYPRGLAPRVPTSDPRYQQGSPRTPMSQLPPPLTDEQLAVMDRVSREAIDERLRVLEGVSGAVYRCIDDLMRMRSVLPSTSPTATSPRPSPAVPPTDASNSVANLPPPTATATEILDDSVTLAPESIPSRSKARDGDVTASLTVSSNGQSAPSEQGTSV